MALVGAKGVSFAAVKYGDKVRSVNISSNVDESFTTFYHGTSADIASDIRIKGIDLSKGSDGSDFGQGFYMATSKDEALSSAARLYGDNVDVVTFNVPNSELSKLSSLRFNSADADWKDFVKFHRKYYPQDLLHGGQSYDLVDGPLFGRWSGLDRVPVPRLDRANQTSIHTQNSVDLFNRYTLQVE